MLTAAVRAPWLSSRAPCVTYFRDAFPRRLFASRRATVLQNGEETSEEELKAAREWLAKLDADTIPRHICEVAFSRSSGPGGQNVNKSVARRSCFCYFTLTDGLIGRVNTKATLRVPFSSLLPLVPSILHPQIRSSRYAAERTDSLVIQSDESRKQSANVESCFGKLQQLLANVGKDAVRGETSEEQKERVRKL
jgi:peptidyl-tRNA hydrolase ICT1